MPVTMAQAMNESEFHYGPCVETHGPRGGVTYDREVWRRNGKTRTWRTRPSMFSVPVKFGMYRFNSVTPDDDNWHAASQCEPEVRHVEPVKRISYVYGVYYEPNKWRIVHNRTEAIELADKHNGSVYRNRYHRDDVWDAPTFAHCGELIYDAVPPMPKQVWDEYPEDTRVI